MDPSFYDSAYYLAGLASGKSNYVDYSWKPDLTLPMADWLKRILRIKDGDTLLDFGCARGYLVKALRTQGIQAHGYDLPTLTDERILELAHRMATKYTHTAPVTGAKYGFSELHLIDFVRAVLSIEKEIRG